MEHPGSTGSPARHARPGDEQVDLLQEHSIVGNAQAAATTDGEEEEQEEEDSEHADNAPSTRWQRCLSWLYRHRILLKAALKVLALFLIVVITLGVFLASALPPIDPVHKPDVKIPRDFDDLKR